MFFDTINSLFNGRIVEMSEDKVVQANAAASVDEYREQRIANMHALEELGFQPFGGQAFERTRLSDIRANFEEGKEVRAAGRLMTMRRMGKASFATFNDGTGNFQLFFKKDLLSEAEFKGLKLLNLGDFLGVEGSLFNTKTGEKTIQVHKWTLLSKAIMQPPEKFHGLQDIEDRYRRRYLDLMMNEESRDRFYKRSKILSEIRHFLEDRGFMEVETPMMQGQAGGAAAKPFFTHHNALNKDMVLRIAPELYLKRLIVGGFDKIFEMGKDFRNEGIDRTHNPEFTVLEIYEAYGDRISMKNIIEGLLPHLCDKVLGTRKVEYGEQKEILDFTPPYREVPYEDLIRERMGADWFDLPFETAKEKAVAAGLELTPELTNMLMLSHEVYDKLIEKTLRQPTFVTRLPHQFVPLAKACPDRPELVDVFEFVVAGKELCPGYTEQNNPMAQRSALEDQAGEDTEKIDEDFIQALEHGMPPTGGLGMGIDRLVMLLTGTEVIRDVILFPSMKPLGKSETSQNAGESAAAQGAADSSAVSVEHVAPKNAGALDLSNVKIDPLFEDEVDFETFQKSDFRAVKVKSCEAVKKSKKLLKFVLDDGTGTDRIILSGIHGYYEPETLVGKTLLAITNLPPRKMMGIDSCGMIISAVYHNGEEERLNLIQLDDFIPAGAKMC